MLKTVFFSALLLSLLPLSVSANQNRGLRFSGIFESAVSGSAGAGTAKPASYGLEEYANIRMQSRVGEYATFFGALNLIAASGDYALAMAAARASGENAPIGITGATEKNYVAVIELERLHLRLNGENTDFDAGLMRLPFGYGQVFKPTDFLNPPNPLKPDARPLAVLGGALSWHPTEEMKILTFAAAGKDPFSQNGGLVGVSLDKHFSKGSFQVLYSFEHGETFPADSRNSQTHRVGGSVKADVEVGLVADVLYAYNKNTEKKADGLSFSAGVDYSFFNANLILLAEYLYSGAVSSTSFAGGGNFFNKNYLYTGVTFRFNDITNAGLAVLTGLDDASFVPILTFNRDIFQGASLALTAHVPMDKNLFNGGGDFGEFGPRPFGVPAGSHFFLECKLRLRF